jgi:hypothetical protein
MADSGWRGVVKEVVLAEDRFTHLAIAREVLVLVNLARRIQPKLRTVDQTK